MCPTFRYLFFLRQVFHALLFVFFLLGPCHVHAEELFPEYDCIKPNVAFWKKVYAEYPTTRGLVHDKSNLTIIYEVIDLLHVDEPNAQEVNTARKNAAMEKYRVILATLATGIAPGGEEEKRVAALFGRNARPADFSKAQENIRIQRCMSERFQEGLVRSGLYLAEMRNIMRSYGLPEDLAYLPHVESSFNYEAYSKAGASGVWQFTEATGKRFMTINSVVDERRDPILATHAAARYLKANYAKIGDWPLTLTSYNHGESGVLRAKEIYGCYEQIFLNHDQGSFRFASRNFYPEFLAAREVAKNYRQYFGDIPLDRPVAVTSVELPGYARLDDLADYFGVHPETLKGLNPALLEPVLEGKRLVPAGYSLRLPASASVQRLASTIPPKMLRSAQIADRIVVAVKGKGGKTPVRTAAVSTKGGRGETGAKQDAAKTKPGNKKGEERKEASSMGQEKPATPRTGEKVITVQKGETVSSLAARHGVGVSTLLAANGLKGSAILKPGRKLVVPVGDKGGDRDAVDARQDKSAKQAPGRRS